MSDPRSAPGAGRFEVRATADSHFGWIRTRLSVERTMMSWQRTAVALIGFGFAIVQYFNHLQQIPGSPPRLSSNRAGVSGARADFVRHPGACYFALAVLLDGSLSVGRIVRADRRNDKGGNAIAGYCSRHPPHLHRPVRLLCRVVPPHLAPKAKQPRPISTFDTTRPTKGDRDG